MENNNRPDRNALAAAALSGILAKMYSREGHTQAEIDRMTADAVVFADALICELEKPQPAINLANINKNFHSAFGGFMALK
jgi:hypothetical protein